MSFRRCKVCTLPHSPHCVLVPQRWPLAPLLELASRGRRVDAASVLGVTAESVRKAEQEGLADWTADRWAVRCGFHPSQVWRGWDEAGLSVVDAQRLDGGWRPTWDRPERVEEAA